MATTSTSSLSFARILALIVLWLMQAALVLLLINADWLQGQAHKERAAMAEHLGKEQYEHLRAHADELFTRWFVASGAIDSSYRSLLPDKQRHATDLNLAPWFFHWLERRIDAFWWLLDQALYRIQLLRAWGTYLALVALVACVDGLMQRQIKRSQHQAPSSDRYVLGRRLLFILIFLPLLYLSMPLSVAPLLVPLWGIGFAFTLLMLTANMQHQI
jgi:hypothetical protein